VRRRRRDDDDPRSAGGGDAGAIPGKWSAVLDSRFEPA